MMSSISGSFKPVGCIEYDVLSYGVYYSTMDINFHDSSNTNVYELCLSECKFMDAYLMVSSEEDGCVCMYDSYYMKALPCEEYDSIVYEIVDSEEENSEEEKIGLEISKTLKKRFKKEFEMKKKMNNMGLVRDVDK